ncbi:MAG: bifunctional phosphoserine phosphatase/homoserine phosphotransferase ThrH [Desulforegulaceae bacterium]|nr:bifunctional phosphoserine phosphatase/homoserine phosphotransferase ThrH [Desulforegulaceae bacterium]
MKLVCSDLEGVFVPEIWINVAEKTGIKDLRLTTRDISDYNELMTYRLKILDREGLKIEDIKNVIAKIDPIPGAKEAIEWIKERTQFIVLSDTFEEFAKPLMKKLNYPTLLCHSLEIDSSGKITDYVLRQQDQKTKAVNAFKSLNYEVFSFGDSYNDTGMLKASDSSCFFCPPEKVANEFPEIPVANNYEELKNFINDFLNK